MASALAATKRGTVANLYVSYSRTQLTEALDALSVQLRPEDIQAMEALSTSVRGDRYQSAQMAHLDSESP